MQYAEAALGTQSHLHASSAGEYRPDDASGAQASERNQLLRALPPDDYAWLHQQLTPVRLRLKQALIESDSNATHAWFLRDGVASIIATHHEGGGVEVGTVGPEGFVGLPLLFGDDTVPNLVIVPVEGDAWRISAPDFRRALDERPALRRLCLRYAGCFTAQLAQSVACNLVHTVDARCARWLLMVHDRVNREAFDLTHEFFAFMLGVRRAGVTVAMRALQDTGAIHYHRGRVSVVDRVKLEAASCSCYRITRAAIDRMA
ncbi:MAG TPA: Crp/Fnr family transcriptional regulator [Gemmatimonadaceae bacterium]